jgi:CheY-like chemotaxis protein
MNQHVPFMVATLGFEEHERSMVRDLLRVSEYRTPSFRALVKDSGQAPHAVLINADRPGVLAKWEAYQRANAGKRRTPGVMLSCKPLASPPAPGQAHKYTLVAPVVLADLFTLLGRVVAEEHGFKAPIPTDSRQRLFVLSADELRADEAAVEPPASDQAASTQYIATVVIAPPPKSPAPGTVATSESVTKPAAEMAASIATAPEAPAATAAPEIAVIIEPESSSAHMVGSGLTSGTTDIRIPREAVRARRASTAQFRFLVVDDSLPVRVQMKEALQTLAKTVDFAQDADEAKILIDNCKYDVIFLDVILPGKDGYDVCRYIRGHALQRHTPVIMLTGNSAPADRVKGKLAGCDTYLIKPVRQSVLAEVVGEFIKPSAVA